MIDAVGLIWLESLGLGASVILHLHNRYRTLGGEERAVDELIWLAREHLDEPAELMSRSSAQLSRIEAARGLLQGGLRPGEVAAAVRLTEARIVHAHNVNPSYGWRALAEARAAGARVVLHLHQYRLVCAVGVCFTRGKECTRCHGRNTLPGVLRNCRGTGTEAVAYGASLAIWQRRLAAQADAFIVPSDFALGRLRELGAPLQDRPVHVVGHVLREFAARAAPPRDGYALVVSRLAPEKGVDVAIAACREASVPLVIAGDGPERAALERSARGAEVRFTGAVGDEELARLRAGAGVAVVPSRAAETFGLAAAEAMASGLPVAATRSGALTELVPGEWLSPKNDREALGEAIVRLRGDIAAGERGLAIARERLAPERVAPRLAAVYTSLRR
jgi:glycosyltransferase involved in cell wall biosynthesis